MRIGVPDLLHPGQSYDCVRLLFFFLEHMIISGATQMRSYLVPIPISFHIVQSKLEVHLPLIYRCASFIRSISIYFSKKKKIVIRQLRARIERQITGEFLCQF